MIHHKVEQNTSAWYLLRAGIPTASVFDKIFTPGGKPSRQAEGLLHQLLAEFVVGHPILQDSSKWMTRGQELEGEAIKAAEFVLDLETEPGGFFTTDDGRAGCSPDRLIGEKSLLELKCPKESTHVGYMLTGKSESDYAPQLQGQLWIAERDNVIICSYHPEIAPVIIQVERDEEYIKLLAAALKVFTDQLAYYRDYLESKYGPFKKPAPSADPVDGLGITDEDMEIILAAQANGDLKAPEPRQVFRPQSPAQPAGLDSFDLHMRDSR